MLTGEIKAQLIAVLGPIVSKHQEQRKLVTDEILDEFMRPRMLKWGASAAKTQQQTGPTLTREETIGLNVYLSSRSYMIGFCLSEADSLVRGRLQKDVSSSKLQQDFPHVARWMRYVDAAAATATAAVTKVNAGQLDTLMNLHHSVFMILQSARKGFEFALLAVYCITVLLDAHPRAIRLGVFLGHPKNVRYA
jgi:hypothetical protein